MKNNLIIEKMLKTLFPLNAAIVFFLTASTAFTQIPVGFSGKWVPFPSKTDTLVDNVSQINIVTSSLNDITITKTIALPSNLTMVKESKYTLDGEVRESSNNKITKKVSAKLSNNKQSISVTIVTIISMDGIILEKMYTERYSLIDNNRSLNLTATNFIIKNGNYIEDGRLLKKIFYKIN